MSDLATKLHDAEEYGAALRCQQQVVQLYPDACEEWSTLGDIAHDSGDYEIALDAYKKCHELRPDDAEIAHYVTALSSGAPPRRVPDETVTQVFDAFAINFEETLHDLQYRAPEFVVDAVKKYKPVAVVDQQVLDLGCGTGLAGKEIKPWAEYLVGIDLSSKMAAKACETGVYNEIHIGELQQWLAKDERRFDIILSADVLIYFGDLAPVIEGIRDTLQSDGIAAFTVEKSLSPGFELTVTGRYAHHLDYLQEIVDQSGLQMLDVDEVVLRTENHKNVDGYLVVLSHS